MNNNASSECSDSCITEILQVISILQSNACPDGCLNSCDRPTLGGGTNCIVCNTRPIMLYTCAGNGVPWSMPASKTDPSITTNIFRVEKVEGCCCTFRCLLANTNADSIYPYMATDSIFTMNIGCVCALSCLNDTYVDTL